MESIKEIKLGEDLKNSLLAGVNKLSNTVALTLGPNGNTIIIVDGYNEPYITKDGVSVSNSKPPTDITLCGLSGLVVHL